MSELILLWRRLTWTQRRAILELAKCFAGSGGASGTIFVTWLKDMKDDA